MAIERGSKRLRVPHVCIEKYRERSVLTIKHYTVVCETVILRMSSEKICGHTFIGTRNFLRFVHALCLRMNPKLSL